MLFGPLVKQSPDAQHPTRYGQFFPLRGSGNRASRSVRGKMQSLLLHAPPASDRYRIRQASVIGSQNAVLQREPTLRQKQAKGANAGRSAAAAALHLVLFFQRYIGLARGWLSELDPNSPAWTS